MDDLTVGSLYSHNKRPHHLYRVVGRALNCTNGPQDGQILVLYQRINSENPEVAELIFAREASEFVARFSPYTEDDHGTPDLR